MARSALDRPTYERLKPNTSRTQFFREKIVVVKILASRHTSKRIASIFRKKECDTPILAIEIRIGKLAMVIRMSLNIKSASFGTFSEKTLGAYVAIATTITVRFLKSSVRLKS